MRAEILPRAMGVNQKEALRTAPVLNRRETSEIEVSAEATPISAGFVHRAGAFLLREFLEILPPLSGST
jgi:hypothetical protein